jgi:hypothetical protein
MMRPNRIPSGDLPPSLASWFPNARRHQWPNFLRVPLIPICANRCHSCRRFCAETDQERRDTGEEAREIQEGFACYSMATPGTLTQFGRQITRRQRQQSWKRSRSLLLHSQPSFELLLHHRKNIKVRQQDTVLMTTSAWKPQFKITFRWKILLRS